MIFPSVLEKPVWWKIPRFLTFGTRQIPVMMLFSEISGVAPLDWALKIEASSVVLHSPFHALPMPTLRAIGE
jgi:hypothetical protein